MLPHDFPPWGTVHAYFRRWRSEGVWQRLAQVLETDAGVTGRDGSAGTAAPTVEERKFSPLHRLRVVQMCPYLSSRSDRMTRRGYPSTQNVCRADADSYRKVDSRTQDKLCLGSDHTECEHYLAEVEREGELDPEDVEAGVEVC